MGIPIRTPRAINEASRWTSTPRQGWRYRVLSAFVMLLAFMASERWGTWAGLFVFGIGTWLVERAVPRKPDLDVEGGDKY